MLSMGELNGKHATIATYGFTAIGLTLSACATSNPDGRRVGPAVPGGVFLPSEDSARAAAARSGSRCANPSLPRGTCSRGCTR